MKIIAHRGNLEAGSIPWLDNKPESIQNALAKGFDIEIDLRYDEGKFYLGHDNCYIQVFDYDIAKWTATGKTIYVHCKDMKSAVLCPRLGNVIAFAHSDDDFIILPDRILWVHPNAIERIPPMVRPSCIVVAPNEKWSPPFTDYYGVCHKRAEWLKSGF